MTNMVIPNYKLSLITPLLTQNLKVALVSMTSGSDASHNYVPNPSADQFFSAVPPGAIVAAGVAMTGKSVGINGNSAFLAAGPLLFPNVTPALPPNANQTGQLLVYYVDTGNPTTSPIVATEDTMPGLPIIPASKDVTLTQTTGNALILA